MGKKKEGLNTVSITDFNRGKAGSIFKDTKKHGPIYVFKNNKPVAVVLSVKEFQSMKNKRAGSFRSIVSSFKRFLIDIITFSGPNNDDEHFRIQND